MTDIFENINDCCVKLKIDLCGAELAKIAVGGNIQQKQWKLCHIFSRIFRLKRCSHGSRYIKQKQIA